MDAAYRDLTCDQGASFSLRLRLQNAGVPRDLTGYKARMQVRPSVSASMPVIDLDSEVGSIVIDGPAGSLIAAMSPAETAALVVPYAKSGFPLTLKCVYDLLLTWPNDFDARVIMRGYFIITAGVTR